MLDIQNITVEYDGKPFLHDFSLHMKRGEIISLVGESGSGKSTLLKLIAKMYESYEGEISIGGHNYKRIDGRDLAKNVTLVSQRCYLFNSSLKIILIFLEIPAKNNCSEQLNWRSLRNWLIDCRINWTALWMRK